MRKKIGLWMAGGVFLLAAGGLGVTATGAVVYNAEPELQKAALASPAVAERVESERLVIPKLKVSAPIEALGVTTGDRMAMPHLFSEVGWYKYGPEPGSAGTAVIYGHLDNGLGLKGVFKNLHKLGEGDELTLVTEEGKTLRFKVDRVATYGYKEVPPEVLAGDSEDSVAHLNLITCAGHWLRDEEVGMTYDHRLVVYTTLVGA